MAKEGQKTGAKAAAAGIDLAAMVMALGAVVLVLGGCSSIGHGLSGAIGASGTISAERIPATSPAIFRRADGNRTGRRRGTPRRPPAISTAARSA